MALCTLAVFAAFSFFVSFWTIAIALAGIAALVGGIASLVYFLTRDKSNRLDDED
jgi:uncharacterized membrane protein HdeD (DUF308 family)